jgi:cyclophilin family peptidyl-prolyl cis-trans isomerase
VSSWFWLLLGCVFGPCFGWAEEAKTLPPGIYAEIGTPRGTITAQLYFERAPLMVANFVGLAEGSLGPKPGVPFYDGLTFHRVVPGFVVQGGDPAGTGEGGPGYTLPDEFDPGLTHDSAGVLSMANEGPDTNGSQFFLTLAPTSRLDFLHSVFGRVIQGLDVLPRIQKGDHMTVVIRRSGDAAQKFPVNRAALERFSKKLPRWSAAVDATSYFADPDGLLPADPPRAKAYNHKLANLNRATGIRLFARVMKTQPKGTYADRGWAVQTLADELRIARDGVLAVYFADRDDWEIFVGTEVMNPFLAGSNAKSLEERKSEILAAAISRAKEWIVEAEARPGSFHVNQRIKLKVDSVLFELIAALLPRAQRSGPVKIQGGPASL